jgi:rubrerythrin
MSEKKGPQRTETLVKALQHWQDLERQGIESVSEIMERTTNPLVRQIMEIIRNDSGQHHRVQQFLIDSLTRQSVTLTPEELGEVWDKVERHIALERETVELATKLKEECRQFVQREIIEYLLIDEDKHTRLLEQLENFKKNLYPYA